MPYAEAERRAVLPGAGADQENRDPTPGQHERMFGGVYATANCVCFRISGD